MFRAAVHYHLIGDDPDLEEVRQELQGRGVFLKRGDLILDRAERGTPDVANDPHTDHGYRHNGIYIFDGQKIIHLHDEPDDYGSIPEQFQVVVEFPPMYWSHVLNHSSYISFDVRRQLGQVNAQHLSQIRRKDGLGSHLVYQFLGADRKLYGIVDMDEQHPNPERIVSFLKEIQDETHFQTVLPSITDEDPLSLPDGISYEQLLLHSREVFM